MVDSESIGFKFTSALPVTVPAHSSDKSLNYTFSALSDFGGRFIDYGHATLDLTGDSVQCSTVGTYLIGNVAKPGGGSGYDTTIRPLFPSDQRNLTFAGNGKPVTIRFTFTNNLNVDCTVNGITLQNGTFFTITMTNPTPTPFVVHPGGDVDVWIIYNAKDKLIHTDSLIIDATHNLQSVIFTLQGVQSVSAEVPVESSEPVVETTPNPASGMITVQGIPDNVQSISIMNVLGEVVMQPPVPHSASSTLNVSALPPGIYYLRMIYPAGVTSKKIVKE